VLSIILPARDVDQALRLFPLGGQHTGLPGVEAIIQGGDGGIPLACNRGASHAEGNVLLFTNDDVHLEGDLTWFLDPPEDEDWWGASGFVNHSGDAFTDMALMMFRLASTLKASSVAWGAFLGVRRYWFDQVGGFRVHATDDWDLGFRLTDAGARLGIAPIRVHVYRRLANSAEVIGRVDRRFAPREQNPRWVRVPPLPSVAP
jgi:GT2 family glycosyltransferase